MGEKYEGMPDYGHGPCRKVSRAGVGNPACMWERLVNFSQDFGNPRNPSTYALSTCTQTVCKKWCAIALTQLPCKQISGG